MDVSSTPIESELATMFFQYIAIPYDIDIDEKDGFLRPLDPDNTLDIAGMDTHAHDNASTPITMPCSTESGTSSPKLVMMAVSESFPPGPMTDGVGADVVLISLDGVAFYAHGSRLLSASTNHFNNLLAGPLWGSVPSAHSPVPVPVAETSETLALILHAVYQRPCTHHTLTAACAAVDAFPTYGLAPQTLVAPGTSLFALLCAHAHTDGLAVYALAGAHDLPDLAVCASPHLHSLHLPSISDAVAVRMGARYLRRLFFMHLGRTDALKRLLLEPPTAHSPSPMCGEDSRFAALRAWTLGTAYLSWSAKPDMTENEIRDTLSPLATSLQCSQCRLAFMGRIDDLVAQWAMINSTIYL